eukprot:CAMPEP_0204077120 /NCGR_PEP_ID=MMETSP0360-20130528/168875_1 /ASSEMBLY_ACC=CAM_ASM_000342 /TAXON_ID=268821 /ORGANISM="Scrippsiella Hangoei, Strain SHTV-5" /LENGTH=42 /DNA_ID= /DNA_START= /DNA_END= /DNA_ORIENTATION=
MPERSDESPRDADEEEQAPAEGLCDPPDKIKGPFRGWKTIWS